jgi:hypothetical protein
MGAEDPLDLLTELDGDQRNAGGRCNTASVLADMSPEDREQWQAAIANPRYTASSLLRAARKRDIPFTEQSLQRHVRRVRVGHGCLCPR